MTDKRTDFFEETQQTDDWITDSLPLEDEQLLKSFFADNTIEELPDDGFSEQVMASLPQENAYRLNRWWRLTCLIIGVGMIVSLRGWEQLPHWDLSSVRLFMQYFPVILSTYLQAILTSTPLLHGLLIVMGTFLTLGGVWGYNEVVDHPIHTRHTSPMP